MRHGASTNSRRLGYHEAVAALASPESGCLSPPDLEANVGASLRAGRQHVVPRGPREGKERASRRSRHRGPRRCFFADERCRRDGPERGNLRRVEQELRCFRNRGRKVREGYPSFATFGPARQGASYRPCGPSSSVSTLASRSETTAVRTFPRGFVNISRQQNYFLVFCLLMRRQK